VQINRAKAALKQNKAVSGPIVGEARSNSFVKQMALAGHDFLWFDMEHAMLNWETVFNLTQMALVTGITPLIRVTDLQYALVARALDAGALGVVIPRVETREQVEEAVSYVKYPPLGRRGAGGEARYGYVPTSIPDAVKQINQETMVVVQIESMLGVENLDEMCQVPGVDVVCVGPQDLSISLGIPGERQNPLFISTIQQVIETCQRRGVASGMVERKAEDFRLWFDLGVRFLACNTDGNMLFQAASADVATLRSFVDR
jgi:2-dehydro-3-deoxyglucarate aldolase/4-hydroxy-2-oxoheptanedioate aldolase